MTDTTDLQEVSNLLRRSSEDVAATLRARGLLARTITTKLRYEDLSYGTKALTLSAPVDSAASIFPTARKLLFALLHMEKTDTELPRPVRLAGVSASGLSPAQSTALQPALDLGFDAETAEDGPDLGVEPQKLRTAEKTLDSIRTRYGKGSVHLGVG